MKRSVIIIGALLLVLALSAPAVFGRGAPEARDRVVAYSAHEESIIEAMTAMWARTYPDIELEVIRMGSGEVISRVRAEQSRPQGDVIWSIGGEALEQNSDLLAAYQTAEWDQIESVYKVGTNWIPYTGIVMVFMVNTDMLSEDQYPRTWPELARVAGGVSTARADQSGSAYMQLANVITIYGEDEGWDVYKSIMENFYIAPSSGAVPRVVADGEFAVCVTLEDNAQRFVEGGAPVKIVYPEDGVVAAPDGAAKIKGGPNPEGARLFLDWATSTEVQNFLVQQMGRRPVHGGADSPSGLPPLSEINTVDYDFGWSAANRDAYIRRFTDLMMEMGL
ncbi:MAG: extracellular solute-binding protein [Spirochaetaceae bacterium]|nr:MAG: extracellular solute-binding protein [Spirochaetaceae bacterium]